MSTIRLVLSGLRRRLLTQIESLMFQSIKIFFPTHLKKKNGRRPLVPCSWNRTTCRFQPGLLLIVSLESSSPRWPHGFTSSIHVFCLNATSSGWPSFSTHPKQHRFLSFYHVLLFFMTPPLMMFSVQSLCLMSVSPSVLKVS